MSPSPPSLAEPREEPELGRKQGRFKSVSDLAATIAQDIFRRPSRYSVTDIAEQFVKIKRTGGAAIAWSREAAPYMVEPQDMLACASGRALSLSGRHSRQNRVADPELYRVLGPARPDGHHPLLPTQHAARDFSLRRIDRMNQHSPALRSRLLPSRSTDMKYNKIYRSGMILTLSWPSVSEMAGKPIGRVLLTDFDRMPDDLDGEGSPFDLAYMRTTSFGSLRMAVAESSPSARRRPALDRIFAARGAARPGHPGALQPG